MNATVVRYKVKADRAGENRRYVEKVFAALEENRPEGLHYMTFQLEDGVTFVHVAIVNREDGQNPLNETPAFRAFVADIADRCEEPPRATPADLVGAYGFLVA